jgi:hypothetical protein
MPYGRRYGMRRRYFRGQRRSAAGQGGMRAEFSGNQQIIRHSVQNTIINTLSLEDGKAFALPLLVYTGKSENSSSDPDQSNQPTYAEGSRVNHIQTQMQITQEDATKPNGVYIGFISVSFSDAMLDVANMATNFNDLIGIDTGGNSDITTDGKFYDGGLPNITDRSMTINDYLKSPQKRHWIRGLARNRYTLYSGRPVVMNQVMPVPLKNKRGQFGSGWWMVVLNESGALQGESAGDGTKINVSMQSFFKEIPLQTAPVTT